MKKSLKRAVVGISAAGLLAAGTVATAAPAQAATPGNLQILGGVNCEFKRWGPNWNSGPIWQMHRFLGVSNIGGSTMTGVHVAEFGGPNKIIPALPANHPSKKGEVKRATKAGELLPGQVVLTHTNTWRGCWPASISGYTIGDQVEDPFNNVGYWQNVRRSNP
ncbi:hypothetical protein [Gordonia iterans]